MKGEISGPSPHDGQTLAFPDDTVAVVLITKEATDTYRSQYCELASADVDREAVAWSLMQLATNPAMEKR